MAFMSISSASLDAKKQSAMHVDTTAALLLAKRLDNRSLVDHQIDWLYSGHVCSHKFITHQLPPTIFFFLSLPSVLLPLY